MRLYLLSYNVIACALWLILAIQVFTYLINVRSINMSSKDIAIFYESTNRILRVVQGMSILEVVHSLTGIVRSPLFSTLLQVLSRVHLVFLLWSWPVAGSSSIGYVGCIAAWSCAEVLRHSYYISVLLKYKSDWLTKARYSAFILLYPLGISSEIITIIKSLNDIEHIQWLRSWPKPMPNALNFELDMYMLYILVLASYIPGSYFLYTHMFKQRRKALSKVKEV